MTTIDLDQAIIRVWQSKLFLEWQKQEEALPASVNLHMPNFVIGTAMTRWGEWCRDNRTIMISLRLLRNYDWEAVTHVLKHEMAHQIVDEYFQMEANPHGDSFKYACKILGVDPRRCSTDSQLAAMTGGDEVMVSKVKKLLAKGSNEAVSQAEGEVFLKKAQELMLRYNVEISELVNSGKFYVQRPVTGTFTRWPDYLWSIGNLMDKFYNVRYIRSYSSGGTYLELFGESVNVDVAEYVIHVLLRQGEHLYKGFLEEHKERRLRGEVYSRASQSCFMNGLVKGYMNKLEVQRQAIINHCSNSCDCPDILNEDGKGLPNYSVILANEKILHEHFKNAYKLKKISRSSPTGAGYVEGNIAGANLSINQAVDGGQRGRMLNE